MSLATVLIDEIVFLATASDSEIHPDVAMSRLEAVVYGVQQAPDDERKVFADMLAQRAEKEVGEARAALIDVGELLAGE